MSLPQLCIRQIYIAMKTVCQQNVCTYVAICTLIFKGLDRGLISTIMLTWQFVTVLRFGDLVGNLNSNNIFVHFYKICVHNI